MLDSPTPAPKLPAEPQQHRRKVIHIDMDAFYASVEQRDDPALRGKPVAVGGSRERGVVAAASYEARRFGVRSAMCSIKARRKCPELIFVRPRFDVYKAVSQQIRTVFAEHTPIIEPLSLDEAYLDVTENLLGIATATRIAKAIRASIRERMGLTASAGVSYNKFLAKLASDHRKPDGLFVIPPDRGAAFVENLEVGRFHAVGPVTAARMNRLGIHTGLDLRARSMAFLQEQFGKSGPYFYWIARGVDERPVRAHRIRKSVGAENTFSDDLTALAAMQDNGAFAASYALLLGLGSHDLSSMRELLGRPQRVLHATQRHQGQYLTATFDYGDFVCLFSIGLDEIPHYDTYLEVYTASKVIRVDYDTPYVRNVPARLTTVETHGAAGVKRQTTFASRRDSFVTEWLAFHACVTKAAAPRTTIEDARVDLELSLEIIRCIENDAARQA